MTNKKLFDEFAKESGYSYKFIAKKVGISVQALRLKRIGQCEFTQSEIQKICDLLCITKLQDKENIFFAKKLT